MTERWCAFSTGQHMSTYGCCDAMCSSWCTTTVLASKIPRSLANWTHMGCDEEGTYFFSRACHNHCRFVTTGARCLGQSITGWHSAPLWLFAYENTRLHCCQRGVHCVLTWLFWHPLPVAYLEFGSREVRPLALVLRGQFLLNHNNFVHSENTISEHMAIFKENICKFFKYL